MKKRVVLASVLTFLLALSGVVAVQAFDPTTFIFATNEEIDTLDPAVTYANTSFREIYVLYDRLVTYEGASIEPKPMLATQWDISEDGLTYTFYLRKDVKFHDGTPVTAEAVQYSFVRAIEIGKGPTGLYTGIIDADSCEAVDNYTFRLHLLQTMRSMATTVKRGSPKTMQGLARLSSKAGTEARRWCSLPTRTTGVAHQFSTR